MLLLYQEDQMNLDNEMIQNLAPDVPAEASSHRDLVNPFISFSRLEEICKDDEILEELLRDMAMQALTYAETICQFKLAIRPGGSGNVGSERERLAVIRTRSHTAFIASTNALARNLKKEGRESEWVQMMSKCGRPAYAKFALLIAFELVSNTKEKL